MTGTAQGHMAMAMARTFHGHFEGNDWRGAKRSVFVYSDCDRYALVSDRHFHTLSQAAARNGQEAWRKEAAIIFGFFNLRFVPAQQS